MSRAVAATASLVNGRAGSAQREYHYSGRQRTRDAKAINKRAQSTAARSLNYVKKCEIASHASSCQTDARDLKNSLQMANTSHAKAMLAVQTLTRAPRLGPMRRLRLSVCRLRRFSPPPGTAPRYMPQALLLHSMKHDVRASTLQSIPRLCFCCSQPAHAVPVHIGWARLLQGSAKEPESSSLNVKGIRKYLLKLLLARKHCRGNRRSLVDGAAFSVPSQ